MFPMKFKIWDKVSKEWCDPQQFWLAHDGTIWEDEGYGSPSQIYNPEDRYQAVYFTGRTDKNGKEIYEGDICTVQIWFGSHYTNSNLPIVFKDGIFGYELYEGSGDWEMMRLDGTEAVVGNINEHQELVNDGGKMAE